MKKTKKKFNWSKVWLEIAEAYWTPRKKRTAWQEDLTVCGLCGAIDEIGYKYDLWAEGFHIDGCNTCCALNPKIDSTRKYWWKFYRRNDIIRAQFAEHMAGLSHDDFEKFINGRAI